jgi:hypothetical protein
MLTQASRDARCAGTLLISEAQDVYITLVNREI